MAGDHDLARRGRLEPARGQGCTGTRAVPALRAPGAGEAAAARSRDVAVAPGLTRAGSHRGNTMTARVRRIAKPAPDAVPKGGSISLRDAPATNLRVSSPRQGG